MSTQIRDRVRKFIVTNFYIPEPSALADETSLLETGVVDSTGVLEVISFLEDSFEVTVDEEEMVPENLDSIARISAYVDRKRAA